MLRRSLTAGEDNLVAGAAALCAAAIAARLLDVQACRASPDVEQADIGIIMADSSLPELSLDLGDALAVCPDHWSRKQHVGSKEPFWFAAANQESALWVDPFYGGRGSAPTDVTQWSKGTIHDRVE